VDLDNSKQEKPTLVPLRLSAISDNTHYDIEAETLVGREVECTVSLDSPHISRYHAKIVISNNGAIIEDLNSSNGTFVNGRRIREKTVVSLGDEVRFDNLAFRLTSHESGLSDHTVMVSQITAPVSASAKAEQEKKVETPPQTLAEPVKEKKQEQEKPAAPQSEPSSFPPKPEVSEPPEEENTRILNSEQMRQAAVINEQLVSFKDNGSGPRLVATSAPIRGKVFPLAPNEAEWPLGRAHESQIRVPVKSISRHHVTLFKKNGLFSIRAEEDKKLLVNGQIANESLLKHNDHLQIGTIDFVFRLDESSAPNIQAENEVSTNNTVWILGACTFVFFIALIFIVLISG